VEPTQGEKIRNLLLDSKSKISPLTELFLYLASRSQLVEELIIPHLEKGKIIVLDRYIDSTIAYQGYGRGISLKLIRYIHDFIVRDSFPDITFLIDAPASALLPVLKNKKRDRIEKESLKFQKRVRNGYLNIAKREKKRIKIIKRKSVLLTHKDVIKEWERFINEYK